VTSVKCVVDTTAWKKGWRRWVGAPAYGKSQTYRAWAWQSHRNGSPIWSCL